MRQHPVHRSSASFCKRSPEAGRHSCSAIGKEKVRGRCNLCTGQGRVSDSQERWRIGASRNMRQEQAKNQKISQWKGQEGAAVRTHPPVHQAGSVARRTATSVLVLEHSAFFFQALQSGSLNISVANLSAIPEHHYMSDDSSFYEGNLEYSLPTQLCCHLALCGQRSVTSRATLFAHWHATSTVKTGNRMVRLIVEKVYYIRVQYDCSTSQSVSFTHIHA